MKRIKPILLAVLLGAVYFLLLFSTYNRRFLMGDEAEYLNNPLRVINGELPYRDFWLLFPPAEVFVPAFIYKVFGLNINYPLITLVLVQALIGFFSFWLGRLIFRDNFFALLTSLLVFLNGHQAPYFLMLLIAALFFMLYLKYNLRVLIFSSGVFIGLAFLFDIYVVGGVSLAYLLTLLFQAKFHQKSFSFSKSLLLWMAGIILVVVVSCLPLIKIWPMMIREVVKESLLHGRSMDLPYFFSSKEYGEGVLLAIKGLRDTGSLRYFTDFFYNLGFLLVVTVSYLLPFFVLIISIRYLLDRTKSPGEKLLVLFFLFWGMFTLPKALGRSDRGHLLPCLSPLFFLLVFFLQKRQFFTGQIKLVIYLLLLSLPLFLFNTTRTLLAPAYKITSPHGSFYLGDEAGVRDINNVIDFIIGHTREGDYIFATSWFFPPFYALTNRRNPAYYDSLIDLVVRPSEEKQKRVCRDILRKDTKLIIHYPHWNFDQKRERQFLTACPILQKCLEDSFELIEKHGNYWLYVPRFRSSGNP